jgi:opine dehydrogenase
MRIAVLGGGNGSFAAAADFALAGHEVRWWRRDVGAVAAHLAAGGSIELADYRGRHTAAPALLTADLAAAVDGAELIFCPTPATAHQGIAAELAPHLVDGQVVFLPPGSFGSVLFAKAAWEQGNHAEVAFAESGTLPWLTRKRGPFEVAVSVRAKRLPTGVFPLRLATGALDLIGRALPGVIEACGDALSASLMNAGPIIHPPLIIMNAAPLEHFERWDIHKEGTQPSVRRVTDRLDAERIGLRQALGYAAPHFPLADHYAREGEEWMYGRGSHDKLTESGDWREKIVLTEHRYMREDVGIGLAFLASVAALVGVAVPLINAFLALGSAICAQDFKRSGRSLAGLGLGDLSLPDLKALLAGGFR